MPGEYRTIQFIAKEKPFSTNTLLAILRKHLVVAMIVNVIDGVTLRKFLVNAAVQEVIAVGITTLRIKRSFRLMHFGVSDKGRINIHQIIVVCYIDNKRNRDQNRPCVPPELYVLNHL